MLTVSEQVSTLGDTWTGKGWNFWFDWARCFGSWDFGPDTSEAWTTGPVDQWWMV